MNVNEFLAFLDANPDKTLQIRLPDHQLVPEHFHVTEVGVVKKQFIDCGGVLRSTSACVVQVWVASDVEHRLDSTKLRRIFELAAPLLTDRELSIEIEYEHRVVSQFPLTTAELADNQIVLHLDMKHTACLAPQLCVVGESKNCGDLTNCC